MAIANLHETLLMYTLQRNELNLKLTSLSTTKSLALAQVSDLNSEKSARTAELREYFKALYDGDPELQAQYAKYTEMEDFEAEMDKIAALYQEQLDELTAWETQIDADITVTDANLKEVEAYMESFKEMLNRNISDDFKFGTGG